MQILKQHSHKGGLKLLRKHHPALLTEIRTAIEALDAIMCLTKISKEQSKIRRWDGLLFSPVALNTYFKTHLLEPQEWLYLCSFPDLPLSPSPFPRKQRKGSKVPPCLRGGI